MVAVRRDDASEQPDQKPQIACAKVGERIALRSVRAQLLFGKRIAA